MIISLTNDKLMSNQLTCVLKFVTFISGNFIFKSEDIMEPLLNKEEREAVLREREERLERNYRKGKIIVSTIAIVFILFTVISAFVKLNILGLIINISAATALFFGIKWVRVYYAITVGIGIIIFLSAIFNPEAMAILPAWALIASIAQLLFGIVSSILLFKSEAVIDFMEYQRESVY